MSNASRETRAFKWLRKRFSMRRLLSQLTVLVHGDVDSFLSKSKGIIHIGASEGQERTQYAAHDLPVIWVEPIPEIFARLKENIRPFEDQRAFQYLVAADSGTYRLNISSNNGESSSILDLARHREVWPSVDYVSQIEMVSVTLPQLLATENIDVSFYDTIVLDTQGSELMILRGAAAVLKNFRYIRTEAADFESYAGGATVRQICDYLGFHDFRLRTSKQTMHKPGVGSYYELLFQRSE
jgi:FkbM family methyltransferase